MEKFYVKNFEELTNDELYRIMVLRQEVFIVEQMCYYLDADGKDQESVHLMGVNDSGLIVSYCRLLPKGISYDDYTSIGRVVNAIGNRGTGSGKALMERAIIETKGRWPEQAIKISAQSYLIKFYSSLGFCPVGEEYLEDGIPHIAMILNQ